jgi:CheY-like chemotaxis protein
VKPTSETFEVLLLEDDQISQISASRAITRAVPEAKLLIAPTLAEARALLTSHQPQLCVLDIQLPDGSGIDFLYDVQTNAPTASVAILTGVPLPQYRDQAEAFGVLHFMEKPADSLALGEVARSLWEKWRKAHGGADTGGFSAMLTQLTTLDIIQLKCLARVTVTLEFIREHGGRGRIYFKDGEIIHAEAGKVSGVEAFNEIVGWHSGRVQEISGGTAPSRSVEGNWQSLLMNAVHWVDEKKAA